MNTPGFFTLRFHLSFLPALLAKKWREALHPPPRSPFAGHVPIELTLAPFACIALAALGAPEALRGSILGILLMAAGLGGMIWLIVMALLQSRGEPPKWEAFSASLFSFFLVLGASAGIMFLALQRKTLWMQPEPTKLRFLLGAAVGAAAGYPVGVLAGLWNQKLGFLAFLPVLAARLGMIGIFVTDLVLIFGLP